MAADKLVDSAKLDACCTAEANAIRAKTGSAAQLAYDLANSRGFADAISAIPAGSGASIAQAVSIDTMAGRKQTITPTISGMTISVSVTTE